MPTKVKIMKSYIGQNNQIVATYVFFLYILKGNKLTIPIANNFLN